MTRSSAWSIVMPDSGCGRGRRPVHGMPRRPRRPRLGAPHGRPASQGPRLALPRAFDDALAPMRRSESRTVLHGEVARFQAEIQHLAFAAVRTVIEQELAQRRAKPEPARPRKGRPAQHAKRQLELRFVQEPQRQLELPFAQHAVPDIVQRAESPAEPRREGKQAGASDAAVMPATVMPEHQPGLPAGGRGRARWTRDSIISELAIWMLSGTAIDAQFMTRHGPRGLVAAIRRVFGRFEAALNVAALHNSKLYPEGPPVRGASPGRRTTLAAAIPHEPT